MKKILSLLLAVIMIVCTVPMAFAQGKTYEVGDIIEFGSYPQSEVKDEALINELNSLAPEWDDWTSYGYYSGKNTSGTMVQGDWMRYTDIEFNGEKYRGVKFTKYRGYYTYSSPNSSTRQDVNGYYSNIVYWFMFEPIDWQILDPDTGFVMCQTIIDSQPYSNTIYYNSDTGEYFNDSAYENYVNDYETSSIRQWLNNDFYNTAFTDREKEKINTTTLNNDSFYTLIGRTGYERFDSNSTDDKIFLISYSDATNSEFGFKTSDLSDDLAKCAQGSDYAKSQGLWVTTSGSYYGNSEWLLRSAGYTSNQGCCVTDRGRTYYVYPVYYTYTGVRPALCFKDIETYDHYHNYNAVITLPTCTAQGYTTYTCECNDTYVVDYVDALGHDMSDFYVAKDVACEVDGEEKSECSRCDYYETKSIPALSHKDENYDGYCDGCNEFIADKDCKCVCHGKGIGNFVYKILLAIQKEIKVDLLKKVMKLDWLCKCGIAHY